MKGFLPLFMAVPLLLGMECGGMAPRDPVDPPGEGYSAGYDRAYARVVDNSERALFEIQDRSGAGSAEATRAGALVREAAGSLRRMGTFVDPSVEGAVVVLVEEYAEITRRLDNWRAHGIGESAIRLRNALQRVRNELAPGTIPLALNRPIQPLPSPAVDPVDTPPPPPPEPGPAIDAPARVFYLAWRTAHADLMRAVEERGDAEARYAEALDCLRRFRDGTTPERATALDPYLTQYRRLWDRTMGFASFGEEFTRADAVGELGRLGQAIEALAP